MSKIADFIGTDKGLNGHSYTQVYEKLFSEFKNNSLTILEIGIGGGADTKKGGNSLKMWSFYFPKATIVGLDLYDKSLVAQKNIYTVQGSQTDKKVLEKLVGEYGKFDVIIDDGSHYHKDTIFAFEQLYSAVKEGGYYFVEDSVCWVEDQNASVNHTLEYFHEISENLHKYDDIEKIEFFDNMLYLKRH